MAKRWSKDKQDHIENEQVDKFILEVIELSKKYGLQLSHEDAFGAFTIEQYDGSNDDWLNNAHIDFR